MDNKEKNDIMEEIRKNVDVFLPASNDRYRIRCPFCGDSGKDPTHVHCYIKNGPDPNEPLLWICFLCNRSGVVNASFLEKLGIKSNIVKKMTSKFRKIPSIKNTNIDIIIGNPIEDSPQTKYVEDRLGEGFEISDFERFKIIWDMNSIRPYVRDKKTLNTLPNNHDSISFLSDDKSMLLSRSFITDKWRKIHLFSSENRAFYTIKSTFNLFTEDPIYVNIAEGIFDILSAYKNFNDGENSAYIAILGSDYVSGVVYAINKGFIGKNVVIKIYVDENIDINSLKISLKRYKYFFKKILIYKNLKSKDIGVKIKDIRLKEDKV